jgi:natural resistance-associated macrophage protein
VFGLKHSLHRGVKGAKGFYAVYGGVILAAAAIVLIPGSPLGLLTEGVQALAGVLLPSASIYLLLLCNDRQVLGPWVNGLRTNIFTTAVVAVLVALSVILTTSVLYPGITARQILGIMAAFGAAGLALAGYVTVRRLRAGTLAAVPIDRTGRDSWRMPPLALLTRPPVPRPRMIGMTALRLYLAMATILVIVKIVQLAIGH